MVENLRAGFICPQEQVVPTMLQVTRQQARTADWNKVKKFINVKETTLITGDFNVCTVKDEGNAVTKMLQGLGFKQLVKDATHIQGGHIDHCYWLDKTKRWEWPQLELYTPYYSDHDCLLVTLKKK